MLCEPAARVVVFKVAIPPLKAWLPIVTPSDINVTVPVGVPAPELTVTVSVTDWRTADGFAELVSAVVVLAFPTV